jgi:Tfp pilus assembly protein PilO
MLTGIIAGILIMLLLFVVLFLGGMAKTCTGQVKELSKALSISELANNAYKTAAAQAVVVNVSEEQLTNLAARLSGRIQMMLEASTQAQLKKMN